MIISLFRGYPHILFESFIMLIPILTIFFVYNFAFLKLSKRRFLVICRGIVLSFVGLTLFLQGVNVGYIGAGTALGEALAALPYNWVLVPIGFVLGFVVSLAEPAVRVLVQEIDKVTAGFLSQKIMLLTMCVGVAISIALAMLKILLNVSLWYFVVPGYILAFVVARFVPPDFTSIAFDSGGVATGTMTATFLLSLAIGAANQIEQTNPLLDGFGIISLVALIPILTVLALGLIYRVKAERAQAAQRAFEEPLSKTEGGER
jgi:hypothetical protein